MARTKEFDPDLAVQRALEVFWARGYAATSTQDLVEALGINRSSLYGTFGSKRELYLRALERYGGPPGLAGLAALQEPGPLRDRLREALLSYAEEDLDPGRSRGCFACNAGAELGPVDADVRRLVARSFDGVRDVLRGALTRARADGELHPDTDVEALASLLVVSIEGLRVVAKGARDRRLTEQAIDAIIARL
ncbi:MAG: TetR/AcrR family transcriptional regulator [Actinobacteria bacterium]|nr:TetR/AcrR family transcriptional regulator [Actinomycetota bacterium]